MGRRLPELYQAVLSSDDPPAAGIASINGLPWELFWSRERAAAALNLSLGGLGLAMQRGELNGLYIRVGRSVRFCGPALLCRSLGLADPAALACFCRELGIRDLAGLLSFLGCGREAGT